MAAAANLTINDGLATPVAHTFEVARLMPEEALFEDRASGIYIGYNKLVLSVQRPKGPAAQATRNIKAVVRVETPKMETLSNNTVSGISPAPTVSYRPVAELTFTFPERCSLQDRKDILAYVKNVLSNAVTDNLVQKFELPY